ADAGHIDLGIAAAQAATIAGDADALRTLLRNLVDNAVRYTPPAGGAVGPAEAPPAETGPWGAEKGRGIRPKERQRVFDRFYRRAGTARAGSGLGLAIVKAIADAHGAAVSLDAGPSGKGLAVSVTFPAQSVADPRPSPAVTQRSPAGQA